MYKHNRFRIIMVMVLALVFTLSMLSPVYAGGKGTAANGAPVINGGAESAAVSTNENQACTVNLTASDPNRDSLNWSISIAPTQGIAGLNEPIVTKGKSQVTINYTPNLDYNGTDSFVVKVDDNKGGTDIIAVNVTIIAEPTPPPVPTTINYVALGDSIATGTIYPGASITSYVTLFHEFLIVQNPNAQVTLQNFATNGDRTNELFVKLGLNPGIAGNTDLLNAIETAEIITISIGGNNLMQAAKDESALGGYNFNNIDAAVAEQGVADFNAQWKPIIEKIKSLNANAQIIWITMYNPYNESDAEKHNQVDSYLFRTGGTGINDIIGGNTSLGYSVADVYKAFNDGYKNNMGAVTYFYPDPLDLWGNLTRNPHPNSTGQGIIELLHEQAYVPISQ